MIRFASLAASDRFTVIELRLDFSVSRKTGHKWQRRWERPNCTRAAGGDRGCAHGTVEQIERLILR